jgi:hypothetical protein
MHGLPSGLKIYPLITNGVVCAIADAAQAAHNVATKIRPIISLRIFDTIFYVFVLAGFAKTMHSPNCQTMCSNLAVGSAFSHY